MDNLYEIALSYGRVQENGPTEGVSAVSEPDLSSSCTTAGRQGGDEASHYVAPIQNSNILNAPGKAANAFSLTPQAFVQVLFGYRPITGFLEQSQQSLPDELTSIFNTPLSRWTDLDSGFRLVLEGLPNTPQTGYSALITCALLCKENAGARSYYLMAI